MVAFRATSQLHVDSECDSLLAEKYRQIIQEINYLVFGTGQGGV